MVNHCLQSERIGKDEDREKGVRGKDWKLCEGKGDEREDQGLGIRKKGQGLKTVRRERRKSGLKKRDKEEIDKK